MKMETVDLFKEVYTKFKLHFYKKIFHNFGSREATLTTVETFCMEVIYAMQNPTVNEFAKFIGISSPNAAYKVNNLIKKGYLKKIRSEKDKREYYLQVTQKYIDYYNISDSYVELIMQRCHENMSPQEWDSFHHVLNLLKQELTKDIPDFEAPEELA